jgi:hypothetical protein
MASFEECRRRVLGGRQFGELALRLAGLIRGAHDRYRGNRSEAGGRSDGRNALARRVPPRTTDRTPRIRPAGGRPQSANPRTASAPHCRPCDRNPTVRAFREKNHIFR